MPPLDTELEVWLAWLSSQVDQLGAELKDPDTPEERRVVIRYEIRAVFDALVEFKRQAG